MNSSYSFCISILLSLFMFTSCASSKNAIYLQDNQDDLTYTDQELIKSIPIQPFTYSLKPGDRLSVNVFSLSDEKLNFLKKPDLEVWLDERGRIILPVIGLVPLEGLSLKEAEGKLKNIMVEYLKSPEVSIKLLNFKVTILGEVSKQGTVNADDTRLNILEAIGKAGGLTENANMRHIRVIRRENDTTRIYKLNILEDNLLLSNQYFLQPGDIVLINPTNTKSASQQRMANVGFFFSIVTSLVVLLVQLF